MFQNSFPQKKSRSSGFILIEALFCIGLLAIFLSTLGSLLVISMQGTARAQQELLATWAAREGLDALKSLTYSNLVFTETGTLSFSDNQWHLQTSGAPQAIGSDITRTVRVQNVNRDNQCQIVTTGGTTDIDTKILESDTVWVDMAGRSHHVTLRSLATQWKDPQGACFKPTSASCTLIILTDAKWFGGKQLRDVSLTNPCQTDVVIDKMIFTWNNEKNIQQAFVDSTKIWSQGGPGSPLGDQISGTTLDIEDFILSTDVVNVLNKVQFTGPMSGTTLTITLILSDGSSITTPAFIPSG